MVESAKKNLMYSLVNDEDEIPLDSAGRLEFDYCNLCFDKNCVGKCGPDLLKFGRNEPSIFELDSIRDVNELCRRKEQKTKLLLEVYLRYFVLNIIASEDNVSFYVGQRSDPRKFRNFPLYLKFLVTEIENTPFNTHNMLLSIRNFITDASLYYTNGVVKARLAQAFYAHPEYDRKIDFAKGRPG